MIGNACYLNKERRENRKEWENFKLDDICYLKKAKNFECILPHKFSTESFRSKSSQQSFLIPWNEWQVLASISSKDSYIIPLMIMLIMLPNPIVLKGNSRNVCKKTKSRFQTTYLAAQQCCNQCYWVCLDWLI